MADNEVLYTPGAGDSLAADTVTRFGKTQKIEVLKLADGTAGGTDQIPGSAAHGLLVQPSKLQIQTPWVDVATTSNNYATNSFAIGALNSFTNVTRVAGGSGRIKEVLAIDESGTLATNGTLVDLLLFGVTPTTGPVDHTAYVPNLADIKKAVGLVQLPTSWTVGSPNFATDVPSSWGEDSIPFVLPSGTTLFGVVIWKANACAFTGANQLHLSLVIEQD